MNHFERFGLAISFQMDQSALRRAFLQLSKQFHPDFHTDASESAQMEALEESSKINKAYTTLKDPDERMRYILELNGLLGEENSQASVPQAFLMEMMELNELLAELQFEPDPALYQKAVDTIQNIQNQLDKEIEPVLMHWQPEQPDSLQALKAVKDYYLKKRYLLRISGNLSTFGAAF
jgi:molecular chaperone HscB